MNKVFRVELSGGNGCYCELELPAAPYELLDALERLQMPMDGKPDWDILEYNNFPYHWPAPSDLGQASQDASQ